MGRDLAAAFPVFADAFDEVLAALDEHLDRPLRDVLWGDDEELLNQTTYTQPGLFAVEVALYRLFRSWGVRPDFLAGHSIGELAAAHVAGVLSLADAAKLVTARARLMQALPAGGAMVAVQATEDEVTPLLTGEVGIAAVNGPIVGRASPGPEQAVLDIAADVRSRPQDQQARGEPRVPLAADGADARRLRHASPPDCPMRSRRSRSCPRSPATPPTWRTPEYWIRNVAQTVRFADAVRALEADGVRTFVELGPDAVLSAMGRESVRRRHVRRHAAPQARPVTGPRSRRSPPLHCAGPPVDWAAFFAPYGAAVVDLPTYAFTRQRHWLEPAERRVAAPRTRAADAFWQLVDGADAAGAGRASSASTPDALAAVLPGLAGVAPARHRPVHSGLLAVPDRVGARAGSPRTSR